VACYNDLLFEYITSVLFSLNSLKAIDSAQKIYIAYSGGIDSHALLHFCVKNKSWQNKIIAVYVHHGLQAIADDWATHCQQQATLLNIQFKLLSVNAKAQQGDSPEEIARNVRYQALKKLLNEDDVLLVAQHQEDQLETVLLQLFRGAGVQGLAAMPEKISFGKGLLLRPLLNTSQQTVNDYAFKHQLNWVEDPSNLCDDFDRNFLRNQVIPLLKTRWKSVDKTVARSAKHCANTQQIVSEWGDELFYTVWNQKDNTLLINQLQKIDRLKQALVIRAWFTQLGFKMPSNAFIEEVFKSVLSAKMSGNPRLETQQHCFCRYQNKLYCLPISQSTFVFKMQCWAVDENYIGLENNGFLKRTEAKEGLAISLWNLSKVTIRPRRGGEKIVLEGRKGHHSLKKLFQDARIPPWEREKIPLIYFNEQLVAIADLWVSVDFIGRAGEPCYRLEWTQQ